LFCGLLFLDNFWLDALGSFVLGRERCARLRYPVGILAMSRVRDEDTDGMVELIAS
jgi:hypothetical protein